MPVRQLLFNTEDLSCSNLFATVGGDQATVYDDMHMGDFIAVTLNFVNKRTPHAAGGVSLLHICSPHAPLASICLRQWNDSQLMVHDDTHMGNCTAVTLKVVMSIHPMQLSD